MPSINARRASRSRTQYVTSVSCGISTAVRAANLPNGRRCQPRGNRAGGQGRTRCDVHRRCRRKIISLLARFAGVGLQLSPHGDECSATGTLRMISRRHVFHLGGYDPVAPETLFARFRRSQSSFQKSPTLALAARSWLPIWHRQNELSRAFIITSWTNRSSPLSTLPLAIAISPRAGYFSGLFCRVFRCFPDRAKKEVDQ